MLLAIAFVAAFLVRRAEVRRLGHASLPGYRWVPAAALLGALVGAQVGMVLFDPAARGLTSKTVVGGLVGGFFGVEIAKRLTGIRMRTGDAFAVAIPLAQGIGRLGCFLHGCCYGARWSGPWSVYLGGVARHPAQLYEAALDLLLAGWLWSIRSEPRPAGNLFRRYLVGYAGIRFALETVRGDTGWRVGPLTAVQVLCLVVAIGFGVGLVRSERPWLTVRSPPGT